MAILVIAFLWNKNEHLDVTPLSNEAIQSIASVYNKDNLIATNINATGGYIGNVRLAGAKVTNGAGGDGFTWFNHPNGNNYIRGDNTYVSGNLCFGGSDNLCLNAGNINALLRNIGR